MINISKRLETIAGFVKEGNRVADIGSDHALLPVFLVQTGKAIGAIAGEVNRGPWESACKQVESVGLTEQIDVRLGDGLAVLEPGEVDTVCIAGMGGTLICSILDKGNEPLQSVQHLVLQPNVAERNLRVWLYNNGWELKNEKIIKEDGIIYEILYAERGNPEYPYLKGPWEKEEWFELGPFLWEEKNPVYYEKWLEERQKITRVLSNLDKADSVEADAKRESLRDRLRWVEEVIQCIQTDKL
jgi:tRNA (adenine22-N1)-methyltransferase